VTGVPAADTDPHQEPPLDGRAESTGRLGDKVFRGLASGAGIFVILLVLLVGVFLVAQAVPSLLNNEGNFLTSRKWIPSGEHPEFGIVDLLWATVVTSIIAMLVAIPVGVAVALFVTHYAPPWLSRPAAQLIDLLAAVPSIVYGLWGIASFTPFVQPFQEFLASHLGTFIPLFEKRFTASLFVVGLVLAIMVLPIVTALSREVFAQTPRAHIEGALALGATKWEMIRTAVIPYGKPGVISASMLGLGRALGETIAVSMILSALAPGADWFWSIFNGGSTFASLIANNAGEFDSPQKTGAYIAAGLVLFILTFIVNAIARVVIERRKAFTE